MAHGDRTIGELLVAYQLADVRAFTEFYERTNIVLFNFLKFKLKNLADAEDCLHDTFLKIHISIMSYIPSQDALNWVFAIARNTAIDRVRKNLRQRLDSNVDLNTILDPEIQLAQLHQELTMALNTLSVAERELIERKFIAGDSYEDLAAAMALTSANLRQKVSRIIHKIRLFTA